ncbi:hypothetical protein [Micromonospora sp. CA-111912]|uniref:hypothetical protein n=1 Tax=Micromonospora sp. CA-111912 TaxID=3239955 RepID=UPI003D943114
MNPFMSLMRSAVDDVPPAVVPVDLFDQARTRHRRRRAVAAGALAVVLLLLGSGYALRPVALPAPAAPRLDAPGLPDRLVAPPLRAADVAASAPGRAAMLFGGPAVRDGWNESRLGVVAAAADRYRVLDPAAPVGTGFEALLSPDGRYVLAAGRLYDLETGRSAPDMSGGIPLAFSPDGTRLVHAAEETFAPPNTYATPYVGVWDRARRADVLRLRVGTAWVAPNGAAALSPDGGELAVQVRDEVWLARAADAGSDGVAEPYRKVPLGGGRLAGAGSWLPDGRTVAILDRQACGDCPAGPYARTWRLATWNVAEGAFTRGPSFPELRSASYVHLLGWRSADEAVALVGVSAVPAAERPDEHDVAWSPYKVQDTVGVELVVLRRGAAAPEMLFRTPDGITELAVAADLAVDGTVRPAGTPDFGPPPVWLLALALVGALVVAVPAWALLRRLRRSPSQGGGRT